MACILAWNGKNDSKLKLKLLYESTFDIWQFSHNMYFAVVIIKPSESNYPKKNCKFETLYPEKCHRHKSEFFGDNRTKRKC